MRGGHADRRRVRASAALRAARTRRTPPSAASDAGVRGASPSGSRWRSAGARQERGREREVESVGPESGEHVAGEEEHTPSTLPSARAARAAGSAGRKRRRGCRPRRRRRRRLSTGDGPAGRRATPAPSSGRRRRSGARRARLVRDAGAGRLRAHERPELSGVAHTGAVDRQQARAKRHARPVARPVGRLDRGLDEVQRVRPRRSSGYPPGTSGAILEATARFAALVCSEDLYAATAREAVGQGATFLVGIGNDGWFGSEAARAQHLAAAALRAVETRRFLARATADGITAVVDARRVAVAARRRESRPRSSRRFCRSPTGPHTCGWAIGSHGPVSPSRSLPPYCRRAKRRGGGSAQPQ
jgi:hypothetical protein